MARDESVLWHRALEAMRARLWAAFSTQSPADALCHEMVAIFRTKEVISYMDATVRRSSRP